MTVQVFQRGETVPCWAENRYEGSLKNPSQGIKITIKKPDGTAAKDGEDDITDVVMTPSVTGKYVYYYASASGDPTGSWSFKCTAVDGSGDGAKTQITYGSFILT